MIEEVQHGLELTDEQLRSSWEVLDQYGNMSSASIIFVLQNNLIGNHQSGELVEKGFRRGAAYAIGSGAQGAWK